MEALPRKEVVDFLAKENKDACITYLEHAITGLEENGADFHDRLAELYLEKAKKDESIQTKLLEFLDMSQHYRANRLLGKIKGEGKLIWSEARQCRTELIDRYAACEGNAPWTNGET